MIDYCDYCGREPDECVCRLAPDFPDEPILELDTDYLDWDFDEEENEDENSGQEDSGTSDADGQGLERRDRDGGEPTGSPIR